jgi:hypothetical protein
VESEAARATIEDKRILLNLKRQRRVEIVLWVVSIKVKNYGVRVNNRWLKRGRRMGKEKMDVLLTESWLLLLLLLLNEWMYSMGKEREEKEVEALIKCIYGNCHPPTMVFVGCVRVVGSGQHKFFPNGTSSTTVLATIGGLLPHQNKQPN